MKVYDGKGIILGRINSVIAKELLLGEEIKIVNCEEMIISGPKTYLLSREKDRRHICGYPLKGAKFSRLPEYYVRRSIRGMLPWKTTRGKEAYKRILCYRGIPEKLKEQKLIRLEKAAITKLPTLKYITVGQICRELGGK